MLDIGVIASALRFLVGGDSNRYHSSSVSEVERFELAMQNFLSVEHVSELTAALAR